MQYSTGAAKWPIFTPVLFPARYEESDVQFMLKFEASAPANRHGAKADFMKDLKNSSSLNDELREEYDLSRMQGVRGHYHVQYQQGTNLVLLAPDVAEKFQTSEAVNEALRRLLREECNAA